MGISQQPVAFWLYQLDIKKPRLIRPRQFFVLTVAVSLDQGSVVYDF